jgi:CRP-like cAMP-binding protein
LEFDSGFLYSGLGLIGVGLYLSAYLGLQTGQLRGGTVPHTSLNLVAASCVLLSLTQHFNLSAAIIQIIWLMISIFGLGRIWYLHRTTRLTPEEAAMISAKIPRMSRPMARRFLDAGHWVNAAPGTVLATEGEVLGALIYLAEGEAQVTAGEIDIAICGPGHFIGDLSFLDGQPASATVRLIAPARYFIVTRAALDRKLARDSEFRLFLEQALRHDTRNKLFASELKHRAATQSKAQPST